MAGQRVIWLSASALSLAGYVWVSYLVPRADFLQLFLAFCILFCLYILLLRNKVPALDVKLAVSTALIFRLSLLLAMPGLSDDYFRYVWDGLFVANGANPYLIVPSVFMQGTQTVQGISPTLYAGLNSPDYYTVYPAFCQYIFGLCARICGGNLQANVILIRLLVLAAECGSIALLFRISGLLKARPIAPCIYALNPLVIVELTGNLHPESFMIFFLLLALYLLVRNRFAFSAVSFGLAVGAKLLPAIFLPLLIKRLGLIKSIRYFLIVGVTFSILFVPFLDVQAMAHFFSGLSLYFKVFEFNASIYYLTRWLSYLLVGYDAIAVTGPLLAIISFCVILAIVWKEEQSSWESLLSSMLFCLSAYLLLATTVHPWYLTTLVALSALTSYRYAVVWSFLAVLSYSAYQMRPYSENLWLVAIEYGILASYSIYEVFIRRGSSGFNIEARDCLE